MSSTEAPPICRSISVELRPFCSFSVNVYLRNARLARAPHSSAYFSSPQFPHFRATTLLAHGPLCVNTAPHLGHRNSSNHKNGNIAIALDAITTMYAQPVDNDANPGAREIKTGVSTNQISPAIAKFRLFR